jgi:hypothetical protein
VYVFYKINGWRENYVAGSVFYSALVLARCLWICKTENKSYSSISNRTSVFRRGPESAEENIESNVPKRILFNE